MSVNNIRDTRNNKLYGYDYENELLPIYFDIDSEEISKIPIKYYGVLNNKFHFYDNSILRNEEFKAGIKSVAEQINRYAKMKEKVICIVICNIYYNFCFFYFLFWIKKVFIN